MKALRWGGLVLPVLVWLGLTLKVFLRGQAGGSSFGPTVGDSLWMSLFTGAFISFVLALLLLVLKRNALVVLAVPPFVAFVVMGAVVMTGGSGGGGGVLNLGFADLVNLPAYLVLDGAASAGRARAQTSKGLTFVEAQERGFSAALVSVAAVSDGGAVVLGCLSLHHDRSLIDGRLFGLDAHGKPRSTFGERISIPTCKELLLAATPTRTALLGSSTGFGIHELKLFTASGQQPGPNLNGATAVTFSPDERPWVGHRTAREPHRQTAISTVKDSWPVTAFELPQAGGAERSIAVALRVRADGSGVVVATTPTELVRTEFSGEGPSEPLVLSGEAQVTAAGIDESGRVIVYRAKSERRWARYLADGTVDASFAPPPELQVSSLSVADDGSTWVVAERPTGAAVLRLSPDGRLDPTVSYALGAGEGGELLR
ncbi:MAG: hypothetical protein ABTQ32_02285 [Myxococcaceae bacterium]